MVLAFAGRRSPAIHDESVVRERLHAYLTRVAPTTVVGAAACGADLLLLEEARRLDLDARVVLPTPLARFREESVAPDWRTRFDAVVATTPVVEADGEAPDPYAAGNEAILRTALTLDDRVTALVVADPGDGQYAEDFARRAATRGLPVDRIAL